MIFFALLVRFCFEIAAWLLLESSTWTSCESLQEFENGSGGERVFWILNGGELPVVFWTWTAFDSLGTLWNEIYAESPRFLTWIVYD